MSRLLVPRRVTRPITVLLIVGQLTSGIRLDAQAPAGAPASPAASPRVNVNRSVPDVAAPAATQALLEQPSVANISRARVFAEPLVPLGGEPTAEDSAAFARALSLFHGGGDRGSVQPLEQYLDTFSNSPWRPSLLVNLGVVYRQTGAFTSAMVAWDEAWLLTKDSAEPQAQAIADLAVSHWVEVAASFGQVDAVEKRLEETASRNVRGPAGARLANARESAFLLRAYADQVIASGPEALRVLIDGEQSTYESQPPALAVYRPTAAGMSLTELGQLAVTAGLSLKPARWTGNGQLPVPSVMHWKLGHFSPIVERRGNLYRIVDVALGGTLWISLETIANETSGYFLVPVEAVTPQWLDVSDAEGAAIIGHSCTPGAPGNPNAPECGNGGMCGYVIEPSSISLQMVDTPLGYTPPRGPAVNFRLTYQQREILQPQVFNYANVGPMWSFEWQRFVQEEPTAPACVICFPPFVWSYDRGGKEVYVDPNSDGTYDANWQSRAILVRVSSSPLRYERRLPDGTVEVYGLPDGGPAGEQRVFMTDLVDPQGQALHFTWDAQFRIVAVTDAIGQVTTITYADAANPLRITQVTDPFGRFATLEYTAEGQLESITDVIGITSSFAYGDRDFIARLTTPYGTTTFRRESDPSDFLWARMVEATDPLGETEHLHMEWQTSGMEATRPASDVPAGFELKNTLLDHYNTFYWTKRAWKDAPGDKTQAVLSHWTLKAYFAGAALRLAMPHSIKRPLEGRTWFAYPGQGAASHELGWWKEPSLIGRRLDDGSSQLWEYVYDTYGNVLTATDPLGRRTTYVYAANGADVLEVRQTTGTQNDLLASFSNYTAQHRPQTIVDAAGQTTTVTYNSAGQPLTITNPKLEITTFAYDPNGYLTSVTGPVTGATTTYTYDGYGRVRTVTNSDAYATTTDYDLFDRVTRITYPDGTYEAFTYNRLDRATVRDRLGRITRMYHDALGRVTGVRDPLGRTVQQIWGPDNVLDKLIDAKQQPTSWEYDNQNRMTREVRANGSATAYTYELLGGRLKTVTDPKNQVTTYSYALDDALASVVYTNAAIATPMVTYTYDTIYPRLATMIDGLGTTSYAYRAAGVGEGVKKDPRRGFALSLEAAQAGVAAAQYDVGMCLLTGMGVKKDPAAAERWISRAAKGGDRHAQEYLSRRTQRRRARQPSQRRRTAAG